MNATHQFLEMVKTRFEEIETLKAAALERGDIICNIIDAWRRGEITREQADELLADLDTPPQAAEKA